MDSIKMKRSELLVIVRENQIKHVAEYGEAVEDFKNLVVKIAKENLKTVNTGDLEKIARVRAFPQAPRSYEKEYGRAIRMLELSVDDVVEIDEHTFNQLVLDEWSWKQAFTAMSASYKQ